MVYHLWYMCVVPLDHAPLSEAKSVMFWRLIGDWASCRNEPHKPTTFGSGDWDWAQSNNTNSSSSWHPHSSRFVRISDREIHITNNAIMYTYLLRPWQFNAFVLNTVPGERQSERDTLGRESVNQSKRKKANNVKDTDMYTNVSIYIYLL